MIHVAVTMKFQLFTLSLTPRVFYAACFSLIQAESHLFRFTIYVVRYFHTRGASVLLPAITSSFVFEVNAQGEIRKSVT
jgi:hypothetical protein